MITHVGKNERHRLLILWSPGLKIAPCEIPPPAVIHCNSRETEQALPFFEGDPGMA